MMTYEQQLELKCDHYAHNERLYFIDFYYCRCDDAPYTYGFVTDATIKACQLALYFDSIPDFHFKLRRIEPM